MTDQVRLAASSHKQLFSDEAAAGDKNQIVGGANPPPIIYVKPQYVIYIL
jgi:hypothetical protein